ncbi:MAG: hypothetical protein HY908_36090 [Myxococcales bacterium]|nr:hypothetical protein [Myxococcales bacterium]
MTIRTLQHEESLETVRDELVYTDARLKKSKHTKPHVGALADLLTRWQTVFVGQLGVWDAQTVAQAGVDAVDDDLDDLVDDTDRALRQIVKDDRGSARYRRYFPEAPSALARLGLESELDRVRTWPGSLGSEPEDALKTLAPAVAASVAEGDAAVAERRAAAAAGADQRVRDIVRLVDDVNAARRSLYGTLIQLAEAQHLASDWPRRFFRRRERAARKKQA